MNIQSTPQFDPVGTETLQAISKADHFNEWTYDILKPYLAGEILEIGSGIGNISQFLIRDGYNITLSDINPEYRAFLSSNFSSPNVKGILAIDLLNDGFNKKHAELLEKFDTVFLLNVIEHLEDDSTAIKNCRALLKNGGILIVLAPSFQWLYSKFDKELGHYRRYTTASLSGKIRSGGFSILKKRYLNFLGIAGWLVFCKILQQKKLTSSKMATFNSLVPFAKFLDMLVNRSAGLSTIVFAKKDKA